MADPTCLTKDQFLAAVQGRQIPLCADILEAHNRQAEGPRICQSGLLPPKNEPETEAWIWPDGLCLVSPGVWLALGGKGPDGGASAAG
jgi:hypothetical protein